MSKFTDQQYLKTDQYKDSSNLDARVAIHQRFSTNPYGWMRWVFDALAKLPANAKILELGSGAGLLWKENIDRIPSTWTITLSDLSAGMLDSAWRNLVVAGRAFQFKEIDAQAIPFGDETFDAVIANHMLYHVPDRAKAIGEMKRVLKTGGHLFATTVGENHLREITNWFQKINKSKVWDSFANLFTLENGLDQLKPFFPNVQVLRYEDSLHVTELEPLVAYFRSGVRAGELSEDEFAKLQNELAKELKEQGKIFITKDSGLFEATK
ncbi:MAG: methyltransferase domain-containing protein [Anaerolineales bacterium]|nr:methyltransferase domain-containing protein [Anaerolineales bacterium]MCL4261510.1 methyltransferase domain-containing protein [Anaerolineales bacterium]